MRALASFAFKKKDGSKSTTDRNSTSSSSSNRPGSVNSTKVEPSPSSSSENRASSKTSSIPKEGMKKAKLFQFFDKEGDPFYFDMETGAISWTMAGGRTTFDTVSYISHQAEGGQYYENVKTMAVTWDLPLDEFSNEAKKILPSLQNIDRYELEGLIGVSYSLGESLEEYQMLEEYLLELDEQRAAQGMDLAPLVRSRPQSLAEPTPKLPVIKPTDIFSDESDDESPSPSPTPNDGISTKIPFVDASARQTPGTQPSDGETASPQLSKAASPAIPLPPKSPTSTRPITTQSASSLFPRVDEEEGASVSPVVQMEIVPNASRSSTTNLPINIPAPPTIQKNISNPPKPPNDPTKANSSISIPPPPAKPKQIAETPKPSTSDQSTVSSNRSPTASQSAASPQNPPPNIPPPPKEPRKSLDLDVASDRAPSISPLPAKPPPPMPKSPLQSSVAPKPTTVPSPPSKISSSPALETKISPHMKPTQNPYESQGSDIDSPSITPQLLPRPSIISAPSFLSLKDPRVDELTGKIEELRSQLDEKGRLYQALKSNVVSLYRHPAGGNIGDKVGDDDAMIKFIKMMIDNLVSHNQSVSEKLKAEQSRVQDINRRMMDLNEKIVELENEKQQVLQGNLDLQAELARLQEDYRMLEISRQQESESLALEKAQFERTCLDRVDKAKIDASNRISFLEKANQDLITELGSEIKKNQMLLLQQRQLPVEQKIVQSDTRTGIQQSVAFYDEIAEASNVQSKPELRKRDGPVIPISMHTSAINDLKQQLDTANIRIRSLEDELFMISNQSREIGSSALSISKSAQAAKTPSKRAKDLWTSTLMLPNQLESTANDAYSNQSQDISANTPAVEQVSLAVPTEYMRRQSRLFPSLQLIQYFPLELSNIDYFQRAFYIVSCCLKIIVMDLLRHRVKLLDGSTSKSQMTPERISQVHSSIARKTSSATRSFIVYSNDTTNRKRSFNNNDSYLSSPSMSPALPFPSENDSTNGAPKQISSSESFIRQRQSMKISTQMFSLEDMLVVILALRMEPESRLPILADHAQSLGYSNVDEMTKVMTSVLQYYRYIQKQSYSSLIDTGKISNFTNFFQLCKNLLTPIANLIKDKSNASKGNLHRRINQSATYTILNYCQAATLSLNELWNLENQIKSHAKWKEMRMMEMGWIWDVFKDHMSVLNTITTNSSDAVTDPSLTLESPISTRMSSSMQFQSPNLKMTPTSLTIPTSKVSHGYHETGGGVFWRTEYFTPTAANIPNHSESNKDSIYFPLSTPQPISISVDIKTDESVSKSGNLLTIEKASMLYESLRVKLFSLLSPKEIAIHKIIIRFIGYLDYLKTQLRVVANPSKSRQSSPSSQNFSVDDDRDNAIELDDTQMLYDSIRTILRSFNVKKPSSRRKSTFTWSDDVEEMKRNGLGDQRKSKSHDDDDEVDEVNYFYTHPKLRKLHRLIFKSAEILAKLGIVLSDFSANIISNAATTADIRNLQISNSILPKEKVVDILSMHYDLQNLLMPYDAKSAISTHFASSHTAIRGVKSNDRKLSDSNSLNELTGNLVYRIASHIDGHSIASLLLLSGSKELIGTVFKTLHGLTMPAYNKKSVTEVPAISLDLNNFVIEDATSCRNYGFLCSELRVTRLFNNHDILKAQYPLHELVGMNFNVDDLRGAGYTVQQCKEIGLDASEIRAGGYSDADIIKYGGFSWNELRMAGLDITRYILITLYEECGGVNWRRKDNWTTERPLSEWQGVFLNGAKKVYKLDLRANNLTGRIPELLGMLTSLEYLDLCNNQLSGPIPESITNLKNLTDLWLTQNDLLEITPYTRPTLQAKMPKCKVRL